MKELKKQYFQVIKQFHPDKNLFISESERKIQEQEFIKVFAAFKELVNVLLKNAKHDMVEDEDKVTVRNEFEEVNPVKVNKQSMTISI